MPAKIKQDTWDEIVSYIEQGLVQRQAYELAGISNFAYYTKLKNDNNYYNIIKRAEQKFKQTHLDNIISAAKKDWHASAWLLERIHPKEYAKVEKLENKDVDEFSGYTDEELDKEINELEKRLQGKDTPTIKRKATKVSEN